MKEVGPRRCDPLGDFDSPETLGESVGALAGLYGGCYIVSLLIMKRLSRKYD